MKIFSCLNFGNNIDKHTAVTDFNNELKTYRKYGVSYTQYLQGIIDGLIYHADIPVQLYNAVI